MFSLGNFSIDEIIYGVAENFEGKLLYTLDQLSSASIEISSESQDITDKNGNIIRTIYKNKTGTFNATNALLNPQIMNAGSGSNIDVASSTNTIIMPKVEVVAQSTNADAAKLEIVGTMAGDNPSITGIQVIGLLGSGANTESYKQVSSVPKKREYSVTEASGKVTITFPTPALDGDEVVSYFVKYNRKATDGYKLSNNATSFPQTVQLTLYCSYVDPCDDELRACYVVLPSFQASPEVNISLDAENQEVDFNGNLQIKYCSPDKALYYIYFPDENAVKTVVTGNAQ